MLIAALVLRSSSSQTITREAVAGVYLDPKSLLSPTLLIDAARKPTPPAVPSPPSIAGIGPPR